jgi:hypothetical protein
VIEDLITKMEDRVLRTQVFMLPVKLNTGMTSEQKK